MKQLLTLEDIEREYGIPAQTIRIWIRRKQHPLPAFKPGKHYLVKREDLERFLEESRTGQIEKE